VVRSNFEGIGTMWISEAILQMRRESIAPALLNMIRLLCYVDIAMEIRGEAMEIRGEATVDTARSISWLKQWLQNVQMRAPEPIESARW
jgi:hypothetical protein